MALENEDYKKGIWIVMDKFKKELKKFLVINKGSMDTIFSFLNHFQVII